MQSHAQVGTAHGARYMTQLAKHWSHKFETSFDARQATIVLPNGVCRMEAGPDGVALTVEAADEEALAQMERVVAGHLARFSFREPDLAVNWVRDEA